MAQQLVQNGQAYNVLNQYSLNELLNTTPTMVYEAMYALEGSGTESDVVTALEQYNQLQLWQTMVNCMDNILISLFNYDQNASINLLVNLCLLDRDKMNTIAGEMGYDDPESLTNELLAELLLSEQRFDELKEIIYNNFTLQEIPFPSGTSTFSITSFVLNYLGYYTFVQSLTCYDHIQLKLFLTTYTGSEQVKHFLISGNQQEFLLILLTSENFVLFLQKVIQFNFVNSINNAITNMQTQPVYNYLTWVKTSFGNNAYNSLASNLEFTRTLKLNDWQLYGSSRLGVYNADTTLTNITFTINGIDSNGNFEVNQVISQTTASINHYDMQHELAYKQFELTSYNGNVLATVLDRKTNNNADVVSANNYYPFHSTMQSFSVANTNSYPYGGANGQMKDDEVFKGAYTAEFWQYDSRLGRRWNMDPVVKEHESPFAVFTNNSNWFIDLNGDDSVEVEGVWKWRLAEGEDYCTVSGITGVPVESLRAFTQMPDNILRAGFYVELQSPVFKEGDEIRIVNEYSYIGIIKVQGFGSSESYGSKGVGIRLEYKDINSGLSNFNWVQSIRTNYLGPGATSSPYNDPPDDPMNSLLYIGTNPRDYSTLYGNNFQDSPKRPNMSYGVFWIGELSSVGWNGNAYEPLITLRYSFYNPPNKDYNFIRGITISTPSMFQIQSIEKAIPISRVNDR